MCPSAPAACRAGPGQWIRARVVCSPSLQRFAQGLDTGGIRRFFRGPCSISRRVRPFTQSLFPHAVDCARRLLVSLPCSNSRRAWLMEAYGKVCAASLCASPAAFRAGRVPSVFPRAPVAHVWRICLCAHVRKKHLRHHFHHHHRHRHRHHHLRRRQRRLRHRHHHQR